MLITGLGFPAIGQYAETIRSDRPGQANSPYTAGKKILQIQTGLHIGGYNPEEEGKGSTFSIPLFFRYGITETVEINTFWGIGWDKYKVDDYSFTSAGLNNAAFGLRFNILRETEKIPAIGFDFSYKTKLISKDFRPDYPATKFNLIAAKSISDQAGLAINLCLSSDERFPPWVLTDQERFRVPSSPRWFLQHPGLISEYHLRLQRERDNYLGSKSVGLLLGHATDGARRKPASRTRRTNLKSPQPRQNGFRCQES